jgi:ribonuclease BN (tRNA processing enzyme)
MRLRVLGNGGGCPAPGGTGPGFLVETASARVLLDCGSGVAARLMNYCRLDDLDAVVLTHLHADHVLDIITLAYALLSRAQTDDQTVQAKRIPVYVPAGETAALAAFSAALGHSWRLADLPDASPAYQTLRADIEKTGDVILALMPPVEYELEGILEIAGIKIDATPMKHGRATAALRVTAEGGSFLYSGDTGPTPALAQAARDADLLICDSMAASSGPRFYDGHLTPTEAATAAREAGVGELVLTHLSPFADGETALAEAKLAYNGPVRLAQPGDVYQIGDIDA